MTTSPTPSPRVPVAPRCSLRRVASAMSTPLTTPASGLLVLPSSISGRALTQPMSP